mmetsp:Transcript_44160/g.99534  ORF Transcript_44160/g.99534 Transcript_44160/m.99534 type:complete len:230 (-) Transcript_44160:599-1288(-)
MEPVSLPPFLCQGRSPTPPASRRQREGSFRTPRRRCPSAAPSARAEPRNPWTPRARSTWAATPPLRPGQDEARVAEVLAAPLVGVAASSRSPEHVPARSPGALGPGGAHGKLPRAPPPDAAGAPRRQPVASVRCCLCRLALDRQSGRCCDGCQSSARAWTPLGASTAGMRRPAGGVTCEHGQLLRCGWTARCDQPMTSAPPRLRTRWTCPRRSSGDCPTVPPQTVASAA